MTMIERMARAAAEDTGHVWDDLPDDAGNTGDPDKYWYLSNARAVLAVLREPTEAMRQAGDEAAWEGADLNDDQPTIVAVWPAMIDAALAEEK